MLKKAISLFSVFLGLLLFPALTYIGYENAFQELSSYSSIENNVIEKMLNDQKFFFKISGSKENFAVYRMNKKYDDLNNQIKIGDNIKVYFKPSKISSQEYNLDVIQIEKQNKVILSKDENRTKNIVIMIIGALSSLFMIYAAFHYFRYGYFNNPLPPIF